MRKLFLICFLVIFLIPLFAKAETCDPKEITIDSISIIDETEASIEEEKPVIEEKNIIFNLNFTEVEDNIKYEIVINNASSNDYELDLDSIKNDSNYVYYIISTEDNLNTVKANSTKIVYLDITYKNKVAEDNYENGIYNSKRTISFDLIENEKNIPNPETGLNNPIVWLIILILVVVTIYFALRKKNTKYMLFLLVLLPIGINALCKCSISLESNVTFEKKDYKYISSSPINYIGNSLNDAGEYYENHNLVIENTNHNIFIRHSIKNDLIDYSNIGFVKDDKIHYISGGESGLYYLEGKDTLLKIFGEDNCTILNDYVSCTDSNSNLGIIMGDTGFLEVFDENWKCYIDGDGSSSCLSTEDN